MIFFDLHKCASEVDIIPILHMRKLRPRDNPPYYLGETKSIAQIYRLRISSIQSLIKQIVPDTYYMPSVRTMLSKMDIIVCIYGAQGIVGETGISQEIIKIMK